MKYDNTNTAICFVENGLFTKECVDAMGKKPVLVVKANIDGVDKEISLWFAKDKNTGQYKLTKNGNKMMTGKVADPYQGDGFQDKSASQAPIFEQPQTSNDADIPF